MKRHGHRRLPPRARRSPPPPPPLPRSPTPPTSIRTPPPPSLAGEAYRRPVMMPSSWPRSSGRRTSCSRARKTHQASGPLKSGPSTQKRCGERAASHLALLPCSSSLSQHHGSHPPGRLNLADSPAHLPTQYPRPPRPETSLLSGRVRRCRHHRRREDAAAGTRRVSRGASELGQLRAGSGLWHLQKRSSIRQDFRRTLFVRAHWHLAWVQVRKESGRARVGFKRKEGQPSKRGLGGIRRAPHAPALPSRRGARSLYTPAQAAHAWRPLVWLMRPRDAAVRTSLP